MDSLGFTPMCVVLCVRIRLGRFRIYVTRLFSRSLLAHRVPRTVLTFIYPSAPLTPVQYVLRVVYREICRVDHPAAKPAGNPGAAKLRYLSAATKGLVQRTRVLSKRLNSLCALHPQLMFELEQGNGQVLSSGGSDSIDQLAFPDPFELGMLEVSRGAMFLVACYCHRSKMTTHHSKYVPHSSSLHSGIL